MFREPYYANLFEVKKNMSDIRSVKCQQTLSGMAKPKTQTIWLEICWLYLKILAICP